MNEVKRLQQLAGILSENIDNNSHPLEFIQFIHDLYTIDSHGWEPNYNLYPAECSILDYIDEDSEEGKEKVAEEAIVLLINKTPIYVETPYGKSEVTIKFKKYTPRVDEEWGGEPFIIFKPPPYYTPENVDKFFERQGDKFFKNDELGIIQKNKNDKQNKLNQDLKDTNQLNEINRFKLLAGIITEIKINNPNKLFSYNNNDLIFYNNGKPIIAGFIDDEGEITFMDEEDKSDKINTLKNKLDIYNIPYKRYKGGDDYMQDTLIINKNDIENNISN